MKGKMKIKYTVDTEWRELQKEPTSYREGIAYLYKLAPFYRAQIRFPIMGMFTIYEWKNNKVRKWL